MGWGESGCGEAGWGVVEQGETQHTFVGWGWALV